MSLVCPQCKSEKVTHPSPIDEAECDYCTNVFYPTQYPDLYKYLSRKTTVELPEFKTPLTIQSIDLAGGPVIVHLNGSQGGVYKLRLYDDATATLKRKKSPSERNQFGSKWTTVSEETWPTNCE